jgi:hypothetical protein
MNPTSHDLSVAQLLGELKATTESTLRLVTELKADTAAQHSNIEKRVTKLELWRSFLVGAAAAFSYIGYRIGDLVAAGGVA